MRNTESGGNTVGPFYLRMRMGTAMVIDGVGLLLEKRKVSSRDQGRKLEGDDESSLCMYEEFSTFT